MPQLTAAALESLQLLEINPPHLSLRLHARSGCRPHPRSGLESE